MSRNRMFFKKKKKRLVIDQKRRKCWIFALDQDHWNIWNKRFFLTFLCVQCLATAVKISYTERKKWPLVSITAVYCLILVKLRPPSPYWLIEQLHIWKPSLLYSRINWRKANIWCQLKPPDWRNKCQNLSPTSKPSSPDQRYLSLPTYQQIG